MKVMDDYVPPDPVPEMTDLEKAAVMLGVAGYTAWSNSLIGAAPPSLRNYYDRASNPQPGDLVVETSSFWIRMRDGNRPFVCVGRLVSHAVEQVPYVFDDDHVPDPDDDLTYNEEAWYVDLLSDPDRKEPFRWMNASFVAIPTTLADHHYWTRGLQVQHSTPHRDSL